MWLPTAHLKHRQSSTYEVVVGIFMPGGAYSRILIFLGVSMMWAFF